MNECDLVQNFLSNVLLLYSVVIDYVQLSIRVLSVYVSQKGVTGYVKVTGMHDHGTENAEAVSYLPPFKELHSVFEGRYFLHILTTRCNASAVYAMALCLSVVFIVG